MMMRTIEIPQPLLDEVTSSNHQARVAAEAWHARVAEIGVEGILRGDVLEESLFEIARIADGAFARACRKFSAFVEEMNGN